MSVTYENGVIHFHQLCQHARKRLRRLKEGAEPGTLRRLRQQTPGAELNLAAVQELIADELGFRSWAALQSHTDAVRTAAENPGFSADHEPETLHLRCGHDIEPALRTAGFRGGFYALPDPLCAGPVPAVSPDALRTLRHAFLRDTFGVPEDELIRTAAADDDILRSLPQRPHTVLWCEADPYDQLFLIAVLSTLDTPPPGMMLISLSHFPGIQRFIGLGQLAADVLPWVWRQRRPVTQAAIDTAKTALRCYRDPSPQALADFIREPHPELPHLNDALRRMLQELPDSRTGLSLTETLALRILATDGPLTAPALFRRLNRDEDPLPFLGDTLFYALMQPLFRGTLPLLTAESDDAEPRWSLTAAGRQVLDGGINYREHAQETRWVGGVCIAPGEPYPTADSLLTAG